MPKHDPMDALRHDPTGAQLLGDPKSLEALLKSPEAQTLASLFQQLGGDRLRDSAEAALSGDGKALGAILEKVQADPEGAKALRSMGKKTSS